MLITRRNCTIVLLPGPPREMKPMFDASVRQSRNSARARCVIVRRTLSIFGLSESAVDELAAPIYTKYPNPSTTILFNDGQIELHLTARARNENETEKLLDDLAGRLEEVARRITSSRATARRSKRWSADRSRCNGYTLATAESCTGGLLAGRITDVPGSSEYFLEGVVSLRRTKRKSICSACRRN